MIKTILIMAGIFGLLYILYLNGIITLTTKRSIMFIGSLNGKKAKFTQCSRTLRRIVRFKESRNYYFMLDSMLTSGAMDIELLDSKNNLVMKLGAFFMMQEIPADFLHHKKLTTFERCTARGSEVVASQSARARSVCESTHYFKSKSVYVEEKKKYYLVIHFHKATGSYEFDWE